ncbi:hypothetical protein EV129_104363 [Rhizobium azibense]|uniref:Uncharacterized protein n=2 Tax=Rhizobium azibense TaxID=1136135 RepID=A0A4R3S399_9HYPH|nr:hypothetical protein EV129_104363 [Rhizobium azibense]
MASMRQALVDAVVAALPVAIVFFSGWAYLSSYLGLFDVDATQVSIPFTTVLVYAFIPLKSWVVLGYLILCLGVAQYAISRAKPPAYFGFASLVVPAVALVLLLFLVQWAARVEAREMADFVWKGEKSITIPVLSTQESPDAAYSVYKQCQNERRLRQIIGFTDQMFLLCRDEDLPCWRGTMFAISNSGVITYSAGRRYKPAAGDERCGS